MVVYAAEKDQIKYFTQITFSSLRELQGLEIYYTMKDHYIR